MKKCYRSLFFLLFFVFFFEFLKDAVDAAAASLDRNTREDEIARHIKVFF